MYLCRRVTSDKIRSSVEVNESGECSGSSPVIAEGSAAWEDASYGSSDIAGTEVVLWRCLQDGGEIS